jgi:DNA-directed RNA polymerase specialized sigma24 family protein
MATRPLLDLPELTPEEDFALSLLSPRGFKEIGDLLGLPRQTVQMIMKRALKKLKKAAHKDWSNQ